ncbi:unnamed protein product [Rotaria sordida]|uniref:Major facilitator superfamily (MFS) profile domain-containing protein n=1 Tax=Rotaria sordida TaxID=392033 RepID=A0A818VMA1_9BILA|nr:unnamed protein product [Rotaria sordida]CAF1340068.1 unnamed protein product [Rotaria sordida]CAF1340283.1 unnamed protein product [Rotaria sordida]CAF1348452.1 unnamed protein product [Rotaria sordida]CAF1439355.1 unnamed protein product [Rotaria sordida]
MLPVGELMPRVRSYSLPVYKVYRRRFYVLFVFSFLAFNQCLFMLTFSPIYKSAEKHYNIGENTVDLLLAWGPIFFIPCLPLSYLLLNKRNGLRYCIILLSIIELISTIIRIIPSIAISSSNVKYYSISLPFLHVGQILNAVCGPLVMAPVSQLSCLWFDTNERTRATTVAIMAYNAGSTTGFLLGPSIVNSPEKVPNLLYVHVGFALCACILSLIYFPGQPPTPPSPAAELLIRNSTSEIKGNSWRSYIESLRRCFTTRSFVLLVIAGGLIGGTYATWISLFDVILTDDNYYTEKQSGWFGFTTSLAEIIGGLILATIADMPRFHRSFKVFIIISFICYIIFVGWFNLSIKTLFYDKPVLPSSVVTIAFSVGLAGFFQGAASPLTYEMLAEIMYPLPESLSASILVEFINITSLVLLFIAPNRYQVVNFLILIIIGVCIILVSLTRFTYNRRDADIRKRSILVPSDVGSIHETQMNSIRTLSQIDPNIDTVQTNTISPSSFVNPIIDLSDT